MNKEIVVKLTKCVLVLTENELFTGLRPDIMEKAVARGKGYLRVLKSEKRQTTGRREGIAL